MAHLDGETKSTQGVYKQIMDENAKTIVIHELKWGKWCADDSESASTSIGIQPAIHIGYCLR